MCDLSSIKQYITELDISSKQFVVFEIGRLGVEQFLNNEFVKLDCSRVSNSGLRLMQTIGYPYVHIISETIFVINEYIDDDKKDEYFTKLLDIHNKNVEYETLNPPVWYGGDKAKKAFKSFVNKGNKSSKTKKEPKPKGPSAAERKLAAKVAKINKLSINIKPKMI